MYDVKGSSRVNESGKQPNTSRTEKVIQLKLVQRAAYNTTATEIHFSWSAFEDAAFTIALTL